MKNAIGEGHNVQNNKFTDKTSDLVDKAVRSMKSTWVKLDDKVSDDSCLKKFTRALRDFEDPVKTARCSMPRLVFTGVTLAGLTLFIIEIILYDSIADLGAGLMVSLLGFFVTVFIGGDLFMFESFKKIVNELGWQIDVLKASRIWYKNKLVDLKDVREGLEHVQKQMDGDIDKTTTLLSDMERLGKMQTVTSVVNMFHNADYEGKGSISGEEAHLLFPHITILWEIVPGYDQAKVIEYVRQHGMTRQQFYPIVDALVQENEALAIKALEDLIGEKAEDIAGVLVPEEGEDFEQEPDLEAPKSAAPQLETVTEHSHAPPLPTLPDDGPDVEAAASPVPVRMVEIRHSMAPPPTPGSQGSSATVGTVLSKSSSQSKRSFRTAPDIMKPMFTLPTPLPTRKVLGIVEIGGNCSVWGVWHLGALICVPISILIFFFCIIEGEIHNIILATTLVCLSMALTGTGKLIEILRALRGQLKEFHRENVELRKLNDILADEVHKLQKLKDGWIQLQKLCEGNVGKASELLNKSRMKTKMEAVGIVNRIFRTHATNHGLNLTEEQKDEFFGELHTLFKTLPGFDLNKIKEIVGPGELKILKMREIVDVIVSFEPTSDAPKAVAPVVAAAPAVAAPEPETVQQL